MVRWWPLLAVAAVLASLAAVCAGYNCEKHLKATKEAVNSVNRGEPASDCTACVFYYSKSGKKPKCVFDYTNKKCIKETSLDASPEFEVAHNMADCAVLERQWTSSQLYESSQP
eukprot:gnl/Hemi2/25254_TR8496_c0_g1_i1.p1 gnl/Hemi2/25254_TR8496_c0_g1~~gnl/Hemi2/25254_TR8496_c0_g1_i1.p1  ORF type:complete len:127 (-),score=54.34 gnl/Hemi2/25254_TR8496_c0_g1_i1:114-455(-)